MVHTTAMRHAFDLDYRIVFSEVISQRNITPVAIRFHTAANNRVTSSDAYLKIMPAGLMFATASVAVQLIKEPEVPAPKFWWEQNCVPVKAVEVVAAQK